MEVNFDLNWSFSDDFGDEPNSQTSICIGTEGYDEEGKQNQEMDNFEVEEPEEHISCSPSDLHKYIMSKRNINTVRKTEGQTRKFK